MLTTAAIGMALYDLYSLLAGMADLLGATRLEWWANLWLIVAGGVLVLAAAFVRAALPGGLALAVAGLLALQSISLHNASHLYGHVLLLPRLAQALLGVLLAALSYFGWSQGDSVKK